MDTALSAPVADPYRWTVVIPHGDRKSIRLFDTQAKADAVCEATVASG